MILAVASSGSFGREHNSSNCQNFWLVRGQSKFLMTQLKLVGMLSQACRRSASLVRSVYQRLSITNMSSLRAPLKRLKPPYLHFTVGAIGNQRPFVLLASALAKCSPMRFAARLKGIGIEMSVASCRLRLRVPQQLTHDREAQARSRSDRCKGMSQIMKSDTFELGVSTNGIPRLLEICARLILLLPGDDERVRSAVRSKLIDDVERGPIQHERLASGL